MSHLSMYITKNYNTVGWYSVFVGSMYGNEVNFRSLLEVYKVLHVHIKCNTLCYRYAQKCYYYGNMKIER